MKNFLKTVGSISANLLAIGILGGALLITINDGLVKLKSIKVD